MKARTSVLRNALLCATVLASSVPLRAQSVRTGLDVSVEAEATSNPYLDEVSPLWVGAGTVTLRPWLVRETAVDRIDLEAFARGRAFSEIYDFEDSFGGSLRATHRASPQTTYYGQASVTSTSARSTFSRFDRGFRVDPLAPLPSTDGGAQPPSGELTPGLGGGIATPLDDITIIGLLGRSTNLAMSAGLNRQISPRSSLTVDIGYDQFWTEGSLASGYRKVMIGANYARRLSARTTVGIGASAGQSRYDSQFPKTTTLGAFVNGEHQLDPAWSLNWAAGVSSSRSPAFGALPEIDQTGLTGNLSLCRRQAQSRLCLGLARSQQPSTLGQVRTNDSVDFTYSERLSASDRIDFFANYARTKAPDEAVTTFGDIELASVGATLTRALNDRLDGYVFGRASRSYGGYLSDEPSISFGVGIRATLGDRR